MARNGVLGWLNDGVDGVVDGANGVLDGFLDRLAGRNGVQGRGDIGPPPPVAELARQTLPGRIFVNDAVRRLDVRWRVPLAVQRLHELTWEFGAPNGAVDASPGGCASWRDVGGYRMIRVVDRQDALHNEPEWHLDIVFVTMAMPGDKDLAHRATTISDSITAYKVPQRTEFTVGSHFLGGAVATLLTIRDVLEGDISVERALDTVLRERITNVTRELEQAERELRRPDYRRVGTYLEQYTRQLHLPFNNNVNGVNYIGAGAGKRGRGPWTEGEEEEGDEDAKRRREMAMDAFSRLRDNNLRMMIVGQLKRRDIQALCSTNEEFSQWCRGVGTGITVWDRLLAMKFGRPVAAVNNSVTPINRLRAHLYARAMTRLEPNDLFAFKYQVEQRWGVNADTYTLVFQRNGDVISTSTLGNDDSNKYMVGHMQLVVRMVRYWQPDVEGMEFIQEPDDIAEYSAVLLWDTSTARGFAVFVESVAQLLSMGYKIAMAGHALKASVSGVDATRYPDVDQVKSAYPPLAAAVDVGARSAALPNGDIPVELRLLIADAGNDIDSLDRIVSAQPLARQRRVWRALLAARFPGTEVEPDKDARLMFIALTLHRAATDNPRTVMTFVEAGDDGDDEEEGRVFQIATERLDDRGRGELVYQMTRADGLMSFEREDVLRAWRAMMPTTGIPNVAMARDEFTARQLDLMAPRFIYYLLSNGYQYVSGRDAEQALDVGRNPFPAGTPKAGQWDMLFESSQKSDEGFPGFDRWKDELRQLTDLPTGLEKAFGMVVWASLSRNMFGSGYAFAPANAYAVMATQMAKEEMLYALGTLQAGYPQFQDRALYVDEISRRVDAWMDANAGSRGNVEGLSPQQVWARLASLMAHAASSAPPPPSPFASNNERVRTGFQPGEATQYAIRKVREARATGRMFEGYAQNNLRYYAQSTYPDKRSVPWLVGARAAKGEEEQPYAHELPANAPLADRLARHAYLLFLPRQDATGVDASCDAIAAQLPGDAERIARTLKLHAGRLDDAGVAAAVGKDLARVCGTSAVKQAVKEHHAHLCAARATSVPSIANAHLYDSIVALQKLDATSPQ